MPNGPCRLVLILLAGAAIAAGCSREDKRYVPPPDPRGHGEFETRNVTGGSWNTCAVVLGDVDADGDLDAFVCNRGEQSRLLLNNGAGEFTDGTDLEALLPTGLPALEELTQCAAFGDVDGDGDLDLVLGNGGQNRLYLNDGHGEFTDATDLAQVLPAGLPAGLDDTWAVALVNVDGQGGYDTDLDIVFVNNGQDRLYLNDGHGEFLDGTDVAGTFTTGLPVEADAGRGILVVNVDPDVSSDTDPDLIILNENGPNRLYLNSTGFGEFIDASFDTLSRAASIPYFSELSRDAQAADLDNDGLVDLVLATGGRNRILLNRGQGFFTDGASDWTREQVLANGALLGVTGTPPAAVTVFAVGAAGMVRQSPGNGAWTVQASNVTASDLCAAWAAPGTPTAFAVGKSGTILTNATGSWAALTVSVSSADLRAATGTSAANAYFAGSSGVVLRYDGATPIVKQRELTENDLRAVCVPAAGAVFAGGVQGMILSGSAGNFLPMNTGSASRIQGMWGASGVDVYAVGTGGAVLHYWDQGTGQPLSWCTETSGTYYTLNAATGRAGETWIAGDYDVAANDFTLLRNTGLGWTAVRPGLGYGENLNAAWVDPASGHFFAVGDLGVAVRFDGTAWLDFTSGLDVSGRLFALHGTSNANVLAVGEGGMLFHFDGASWTRHDSPTAVNWNAVWMEDATHAWVAGDGGAVQRLDLSTWTWTPVSPSPASADLCALWGSGPADVYAAGDGGLLLWFDGTAWRVVNSGRINGLWAADASNIFAVGPSGQILLGNGSGSWTPFAGVPTSAELLAVWASSATNAYAVGRGGTILHYWDQSGTQPLAWYAETSGTPESLYAVWGIAGQVWAAGDSGTVIRDGGTGWVGASSVPSLWPGVNDRLTGLWGSSPIDLYACTQSGLLCHYRGIPSSAGFAPAPAADSYGVRVLNLNADAFPDILFTTQGQDTAWINDGAAFFTSETLARLPAETDPGRGIALGGLAWNGSAWAWKTSLDGDADADWIAANFGAQSRLRVNDGAGSFSDGTDLAGVQTTGLPAGQLSSGVALGDVDGDGLRDALVSRTGQQNRLFRNRGDGRFQDVTLTGAMGVPADTDPTSACLLADVDGDGDLDAVFANNGTAQKLLVNDGHGRFTEPAPLLLPADAFAATCVAAADLDADGDLDLVFGTAGGQNRLYRMESGAYVDRTADLPAGSWDTRAVALFDATGDGFPDIVFANSGSRNRLFVNKSPATPVFEDGTSGFTTGLPDETDPTRAVVPGDVDADGDLDLVFVNLGAQNRLLINDGVGKFADGTDAAQTLTTGLPLGTWNGTCGVLVDVDHDGRLDLIVGNASQQNRLYLNDGAGEFTDATDESRIAPQGLPPAQADTTALAAADLDGDGDPDLYFANRGADEVLLNR